MKIVRIPKKEFETESPESLGVHHTTKEGEHIVEVPEGIGTKSFMHEIAHAELGHETKPSMTFKEWAQRELAADKWVYNKLDKSPSWNEILWDFIPIIKQGFDMGYSQNDLFNFVKEECGDAGYPIGDDEKSTIWEFVKRVYRSWKQTRSK
jgi:hypothetical protein